MKTEVTEEEFDKLIEIIHAETGIYYTFKKKYLIENRLQRRLEELKLTSFTQYIEQLKGANEMQILLNSITTNETSFFRNPLQLLSFTNIILPEVIRNNRDNNRKKIRIWCSASSSGEEIYTFAMVMAESRLVPPKWEVELIASDINDEMLEYARKGIYRKHTLRNTSEEYRKKYFKATGEDEFHIKQNLLPPVRFEKINLMKQRIFPILKDFDIVLCCNVLIYFSDKAKIKVIADIYGSMNDPGFLYIGHSESLRNISKDFKLINAKGIPVYKKEGKGEKNG